MDSPTVVDRHFSGLCAYGFRLTERAEHRVVYTRDDVRVILSSDPRGELAMDLETTGPPPRRATVSEVEGFEGRRAVLVTPENREAFVERLAALLFERYRPVLDGDLQQVEALAAEDEAASREAARDWAHHADLRAADAAWRRREWATVVRILEGVEKAAWLREGEKRRLEVARGRVGGES